MYQYRENKNVFSERLNASVLMVESRVLPETVFQTAGLVMPVTVSLGRQFPVESTAAAFRVRSGRTEVDVDSFRHVLLKTTLLLYHH